MAKSKKSTARSKKKTAGKVSGKSRKKTPGKAKAKAKGRQPAAPRMATSSSDVSTDPTVSFVCETTQPRYPGAPAGLWEKVADIPEFAALLPRGQITIIVKPEEEA